jgi:hypothetical protein
MSWDDEDADDGWQGLSEYSDIWANLTENNYQFYGELISGTNNTWMEGGQSEWEQFLQVSLPEAVLGGIESMAFIHKNVISGVVQETSLTICSNSLTSTNFSSALYSVASSPSSTTDLRSFDCGDHRWLFQRCHSGIISICIDCDNPCYSSCASSSAMYPCSTYNCWSQDDILSADNNHTEVIHFFGVEGSLPQALKSRSSHRNSDLTMVLLVAFCTLLVVMLALMMSCFRTIRNRRMNRKDLWKERQMAWKTSNSFNEGDREIGSQDSTEEIIVPVVSATRHMSTSLDFADDSICTEFSGSKGALEISVSLQDADECGSEPFSGTDNLAGNVAEPQSAEIELASINYYSVTQSHCEDSSIFEFAPEDINLIVDGSMIQLEQISLSGSSVHDYEYYYEDENGCQPGVGNYDDEFTARMALMRGSGDQYEGPSAVC